MFGDVSTSWPVTKWGTSLLRRILPGVCKEMTSAHMALLSVQNTIWRFSFAFLVLVHHFHCHVGVPHMCPHDISFQHTGPPYGTSSETAKRMMCISFGCRGGIQRKHQFVAHPLNTHFHCWFSCFFIWTTQTRPCQRIALTGSIPHRSSAGLIRGF
jgi:hypothetical protein